jgi:hypothetical protein
VNEGRGREKDFRFEEEAGREEGNAGAALYTPRLFTHRGMDSKFSSCI